jgi:hypothetical protein
MNLAFDPKTVARCLILTQKDRNVTAIEVHFKDGTSRLFQGEELTKELMNFAQKMSRSPTV